MGTSNHQTYYQTKNEKNVEKLRSLLKEFPRFSKDFFRGIEPTSSINTRTVSYTHLDVYKRQAPVSTSDSTKRSDRNKDDFVATIP